MTRQRRPSLSQLIKQYIRVQQAKSHVWEEERKMSAMAVAANGSYGIVENTGVIYRINARTSGYSGNLVVEKLGRADELKEVIK
jgi:hypothetical protein